MGTDNQNDDGEQLVDRRKYQSPHDPRVTIIMTVATGVMATLVAAGVIAMFNLSKDVAVLLARPAGVPREEYARDTMRRDDDFNQFKSQIKDMQVSVEKLREDEVVSNRRYDLLHNERNTNTR